MNPPGTPDQPEAQNQPFTEDEAADQHGYPTEIRRGRPSLEEAQRLPVRILEAGWEVLCQHGFDGFTFDRIARHARIGKATIYSRFTGKQDFLAALLRHKVEQRRVSVMSLGADLPLMERFCQRAIAVVQMMLTPDGIMMERLVDWYDQELGTGEVNCRHTMFEHALTGIEAELAILTQSQSIGLADLSLAARFWLEGLLGHIRMMSTSHPFNREETERWARSYSTFFFGRLQA